MENIKIITEYIKLDQFLKWTGMVSCGSDAKIAIDSGKIKVNGEIETRRGRKLRINDVIEIEKRIFRIE